MLEFGKRAAEQKHVGSGIFVGLKNSFEEQSLGFAGTCRAAEETVLCGVAVKRVLLRKRCVMKTDCVIEAFLGTRSDGSHRFGTV